jgi:hypothetical protein
MTMSGVTLRAHYDGERIVLDEPFEIPENAALIVTVLEPGDAASFRDDWQRLRADGLAAAYADDEPEYTAKDLKR